MVASVILIVVVISLSNLLIDSLQAALLSRQREQAASLASDVVENGKALGQTSLSASPAPTGSCSAVTGAPAPVLSQLTFQQCFTTTVDKTSYTVHPTVTASTAVPDIVTVTVTWSSSTYSYITSSKVGS